LGGEMMEWLLIKDLKHVLQRPNAISSLFGNARLSVDSVSISLFAWAFCSNSLRDGVQCALYVTYELWSYSRPPSW
jgi:hypothetical protein